MGKYLSLKVGMASDDRSCNALRWPNAKNIVFIFIIYRLQRRARACAVLVRVIALA